MGNSNIVHNMIAENKVDLGFAGIIRSHAALTGILIHREKLLVVSSPDNPITAKNSVSVNELGTIPFIWREKGTQTRKLVKKWFEKRAGRNYPGKSIELQNIEAAKRMAVEGYGITIIPESAVRRDIDSGLLKALDLKSFDLTVDFYLFHLNGKVFSKTAETFLKMLSGVRLLSHTENLRDWLSEAA